MLIFNMILACKNTKTKKVTYFAGYDISKPHLINWTPLKIEAAQISENTIHIIINFLCIRMDTKENQLQIID